jgi:isoquinoline 1-oxidoreductase subunit alpha
MIRFSVNGERMETDIPTDTPLLWFLRDNLQMTGTKFGCGMALCGACTVHINGEPARACTTPLSSLAGKRVTTIESIGSTPIGKQVQAAWISEDVVQCGYCQSGQIMSATALLAKTRNPTDSQIDEAMSGNICRCGTYNRVRAAIKVAANSAPAPTAKTKA